MTILKWGDKFVTDTRLGPDKNIVEYVGIDPRYADNTMAVVVGRTGAYTIAIDKLVPYVPDPTAVEVVAEILGSLYVEDILTKDIAVEVCERLGIDPNVPVKEMK